MTMAAELRDLLGHDRVLTEPLERYLFGKDSGISRGEAAIVAFPETTAEVAATVRIARRYHTPIVARGAGTGLAGGATPTRPALIVVLTRMNSVEIDEANRTAWVGPGVINLDLTKQTTPLGLHFAPDPSSQSACTIGGNLANNSGGPHCLAEGTTVGHVLAVEMVTAEGDIVMFGGPAPDPIGLDLRSIIVGSEGTLGIITRALVKLTPNPPDVRTILTAFSTVEEAAATVSGIIARGVVPAALEMMDQLMTRAVENFVAAGFPTEAAAVLLAEVVGHSSAVAAEAAVVEEVARENNATVIRVASDDAERARLWLGRKSAFGAVAQAAPDYYLHDTVVPRTRLVETMKKVYEIAERHEITMLNVFHAGDGNLHPLMAFDADEPGVMDRVHAAAKELVEVCVAAGGSLSGEHGIGMEKRDLMPLVFNEADLDAQARLREAFDPDGIFNPGKVLPAGSRCFDLGRPLPEGVWV
jgi:glycolate oxidase